MGAFKNKFVKDNGKINLSLIWKEYLKSIRNLKRYKNNRIYYNQYKNESNYWYRVYRSNGGKRKNLH